MTIRQLLIASTALSILTASAYAQQPPAPQGPAASEEPKQRPPGQKREPGAQPGQKQMPQAQPPGQTPPAAAKELPKQPEHKRDAQELPRQPEQKRDVQHPPGTPPGAPSRAQQQPVTPPVAQEKQQEKKQELQRPAQTPPQTLPRQQPAQTPAPQPQQPSAQTPPAQPQAPAARTAPAQPQQPAQTQPVQPQPPAAQTTPQTLPRQQPAQTPPAQPQAPTAQTPPAQPQAPAAQAPLPQAPAAQAQPVPAAPQGQAIQLPGTNARRVDQLRGERRETREGNRVVIQESDRTIIRDGDRTIIRHNEVDRFRYGARDVRVERQGAETVTVVERPDGARIVTVTDANGRLIRRTRRDPAGREVVIIDNHYAGPQAGYFVELPPLAVRMPRERYIVEAERASEADIYAAFIAPPVERLQRRYTLDEIRYSPQVRERMPRVDIDTINFETGSWEVAPDQAPRLAVIAAAIKRAVQQNPSEVFLIEGHTDAVGADVDNLSLSDRRAESVALVLTQQFQVPAENLTSQGYGEQSLKVQTDGPERQNRRVTMRRITPLLSGGAGQPQSGG